MPTSVDAIDETAYAEETQVKDHRDLTSERTDDFHNDTRTNGQVAQDTSGEFLINGVSKADNSGFSPEVLQVESVSIPTDISTGGTSQSDVTERGSSANTTESSQTTDKQKRGKRAAGRSSSLSDDGAGRGMVLKFGLNTEETLRRVVFGSRAVKSMLRTPSMNWSFVKMFGDDGFIAAGQVCIRPNCEKPLKNVKDNTYIFFVIEGIIEVKIHINSYTVASGGSFMVPRGNNYSLKNISNYDARVFFCQALKLRMNENEEHAHTSFLPTPHEGTPTSKTALWAMWILQRLVPHVWKLHDRVLAWYRNNLAKYEHFATRQRLFLLFFVLGLMVRRLPFVGSPPLINIQFIRVV